MNKEKQQIEEMAITICRKRHACLLKDDASCRKCDQHERCLYQDIAYALYQEGYHKQSEPISCNHEEGGEWISVDERLPEENGRYLVCIKVSHQLFENLTTIAVLDYNKSHGFYLYSIAESVTHWMPLPEAPKMKGGE